MFAISAVLLPLVILTLFIFGAKRGQGTARLLILIGAILSFFASVTSVVLRGMAPETSVWVFTATGLMGTIGTVLIASGIIVGRPGAHDADIQRHLPSQGQPYGQLPPGYAPPPPHDAPQPYGGRTQQPDPYAQDPRNQGLPPRA